MTAAAVSKIRRARILRRDSTVTENSLWYVLRNRNLDGLKFVRQMPVGPYFVDFACREVALVVELDGGQHDEVLDATRTAFLNAQGYSVLRFWNTEILHNRDGVMDAILRVIASTPSPDLRFAPATLSPTGRGTRGEHAAAAAASQFGTVYSSHRRGEGGASAPGEGSFQRQQELGKA